LCPKHPYFWGIPNGWPGIVVTGPCFTHISPSLCLWIVCWPDFISFNAESNGHSCIHRVICIMHIKYWGYLLNFIVVRWFCISQRNLINYIINYNLILIESCWWLVSFLVLFCKKNRKYYRQEMFFILPSGLH